jgi:hypothetical protein
MFSGTISGSYYNFNKCMDITKPTGIYASDVYPSFNMPYPAGTYTSNRRNTTQISIDKI